MVCVDDVRQQTGEEVSLFQEGNFASLNKNVFRILVALCCSDVQVTLDSLLCLFRRENTDPDEKIYIRVKRDDLLHDALKVVAAPKFSFRKTLIVSFVGEETDSNEPVREFFR